MSSAIFVALFAASFLLPTLGTLVTAIFGRGPIKYAAMAVLITASVGVNAGMGYYSFISNPSWWKGGYNGLMAGVYVFAIIANSTAIYYIVMGTLRHDEETAATARSMYPVRRPRRIS